MRRRWIWRLAGILWALCVGMSALPARAWPPDFELIQADRGVALYRRVGEDGPEFVQLVNLSHGATVELLHGHVAHFQPDDEFFHEDNPPVWRYSLDQFWYAAQSAEDNVFCVFNGQFFLATHNPTGLAFALKKHGDVISPGYAINEYAGQQLLLQLWDTHADIVTLTLRSLYMSSAPHALGGLSEYAGSSTERVTGRTSIGLDDADGDGDYEILLVFNAPAASQPHASAVLREFGAQKVIMLDGGGSTQLLCHGKTYVPSDRLIPQALAVRSGGLVAPEYAATIVSQPYIVEVLPGQMVTLSLTLENVGRRTWPVATGPVLVAVQGTALLLQPAWPMPATVIPGAQARWNVVVQAPQTPGIYPVVWELRHWERAVSAPIEVRVAVKPPATVTPVSPAATPTPNAAAGPGAGGGLCGGSMVLPLLVWWIGRRNIFKS